MKPNSTKEWAQKNDFEFSCPHSAVDATHRNSWTPGFGRTVSGCLSLSEVGKSGDEVLGVERTPDARYSQPSMASSRNKKASEPKL